MSSFSRSVQRFYVFFLRKIRTCVRLFLKNILKNVSFYYLEQFKIMYVCLSVC
jgi:hypothetical protein